MSKRLLAAALGVASLGLVSLGLAPGAKATELLFQYSETGAGAIGFSFDMSSTPTPLAVTPAYETVTPVTDWTSNIGPNSYIVWFSFNENGMFNTGTSTPYVVYGPQVYTGSESAPVFAPGTFSGTDQTDGLTGTLTISAIPEPAGWFLMLAGLGVLGLVLRDRRAAAANA